MFDGDILNWMTFWEQFSVAIHERTHLSNAEKLAYLRHSLKDGTAKNTIEGLSHSGDHYEEAVRYLKNRYNRPKLIHQAHVKKIVEIPPLRVGSGRELRRLHDVAQQHLRALKSMGHEPDGTFITSLLQLKLDQTTLFEWQRHDQKSTDVSHYDDLLDFINLRAQASETLTPLQRKPNKDDNPSHRKHPPFRYATLTANVNDSCVMCKVEKHPLFACPEFKVAPRDKMLSILRSNRLCHNCLKPGHFAKQCPSPNRCKKCQRSHHTLIHDDPKASPTTFVMPQTQSTTLTASTEVTSHASTGSSVPSSLLMTCQVKIDAPDGTSIKARALLDPGSTTSFVSERIVQSLGLPRRTKCLTISGIGGLSHKSPLQSISTFDISSLCSPKAKYTLTAIVVPRVTCDLPLQPVHVGSEWNHLSDLTLADPDFGTPGKIDLLLGADIYTDMLLYGRRCGPHGTPTAFETQFGWVLTGRTTSQSHSSNHSSVVTCHSSVATGDSLLRMFWEIEESPDSHSNLSAEERTVIQHFEEKHTRSATGRFIVPLPKNPQNKPLGESRAQAVRIFLSLERSLYSKGQFHEFSTVMGEYLEMGHAEQVPPGDLEKSHTDTFYLPMHAVRKEHSTTTKLRVVFDASAKTSTGVSLNDTLLVGPTVHPSLIDVLLRFRFHRVALTADISKMYRAIELIPADRDLHRFVWRKSPREPIRDYHMTRVTFGVSASSFAANMAVKQNAIDHAMEFPQAAKIVDKSFYVDDCLTGADSIPEAIKLQTDLCSLFSKGEFLLRKCGILVKQKCSSAFLLISRTPQLSSLFQPQSNIPRPSA